MASVSGNALQNLEYLQFKGDAKLILEAIKDIDLRPGIKLDINGQNIELNEDYMSQKTERRSEMVYPNVVEPSFGLDRILYCLLESSWNVLAFEERLCYSTISTHLVIAAVAISSFTPP